MTKSAVLHRQASRVAKHLPRGMDVAALIAGVLIAAGGVAFANQPVAGTSPTTASAECDRVKKAGQSALDRRMGEIYATSPKVWDFFTDDGCLGGLALTNIDLSDFINDFGSAAKRAAMAAWESAKDAAINKACTVARDQISPVLDEYNKYAAMADIEGAANATVTTAVNREAAKTNADYGTNFYYPGAGQTSSPVTQGTVRDAVRSSQTSSAAGTIGGGVF